jgi:phosphate starvation-inducible PhoH-like protein
MSERRKVRRSQYEASVSAKRPKAAGVSKPKVLTPANAAQEEYIRLIAENQVVVAIGPAGSSKTAIPAYLACEKLMNNEIGKIIISRPIVEAGRGIGFLKGGLLEKCDPYMKPLTDELSKWLGAPRLAAALAGGEIEVCPPEFMRGRNFHDSFIIMDEAQNCTLSQIKMVLSRLGRRSKMVINGDPDQTDLPRDQAGALSFMYNRYENMYDVGRIRFANSDIVRNPLIGALLERLNDEDFYNPVCDDGEDGSYGGETVRPDPFETLLR